MTEEILYSIPQWLLGLMALSINQLIDIKTERDIAISNHVPEIVLLGLLLFATLAIGILGYGNGLAATHARYPAIILCIVIAISFMLIMTLTDLHTAQYQIIQTSMNSRAPLRGWTIINEASNR